MGNNIILETKFVADIRGSFYIPSYQRGYRWSETEVVRLLDDIYQNGKKNYCLQPVVVRKKGDHYELIDGQQRLTTLYLVIVMDSLHKATAATFLICCTCISPQMKRKQ